MSSKLNHRARSARSNHFNKAGFKELVRHKAAHDSYFKFRYNINPYEPPVEKIENNATAAE